MLSISNIDVSNTLSEFKSEGFDVGFLVPTKTSLSKSIIDADKSFRKFIKNTKLHDYTTQKKGISHKKIIPTILISKNQFYETQTSLYRPETKNGDPRIWVYDLSRHSSSGDLLAFISTKTSLIVINCSNSKLSFVFQFIKSKIQNVNYISVSKVSEELLYKIKDISKKGFIKTMRVGDTGVGYTLETLLGIKANSNKSPDYKGIEIKTSRSKTSRGTLFSLVPNWEISNITSANDYVLKRGKPNSKYGQLKTLNTTIQANEIKNQYNLKLKLDDEFIYCTYENHGKENTDLCWSYDKFISRLSEKHKETFWVDVDKRGEKNNEEFHYKKILHTSDIDYSTIPILINNKDITLDMLLIERSKDKKKYTSKSGNDFLWKIKKTKRNLLLRFTKNYEL